MPCDYKKYPPDWKQRRERILKRANNCCEWPGCFARNHKTHPETGAYVVLTIAHLDHDSENWDVKDNRLAALCQYHHISYDKSREQRDRRNRQGMLFEPEEMKQ